MPKSTAHLNDEHMQLYLWSGTGEAAIWPKKPRRFHAWHASSGVLALLTSLLVLGGCDSKSASTTQEEGGGLKTLESLVPGQEITPPASLDPQPGAEGSKPAR